MAIIVRTSNPGSLLASIKTGIATSKVRTWSVDSDDDFTHIADQWIHKAWLRPRIARYDLLVFNVLSPRNTRMSRVVYGIYHGRFIEMLLTHFDAELDDASATAMPVSPDQV
jgi:hypothetical protein